MQVSAIHFADGSLLLNLKIACSIQEGRRRIAGKRTMTTALILNRRRSLKLGRPFSNAPSLALRGPSRERYENY